MARTIYHKTVLTGGGADSLDNVDGTGLLDNDAAFVMDGTTLYAYILDATSAAAESSPSVIRPDTNAGDKRWILQGTSIDITTYLGETSVLAYRGDRGKTAYDHSQAAHAPSGADVTATALGAAITGATNENTPLDADDFPLYKASLTALRKVTWANIKATLAAALNIVSDTTPQLGGFLDMNKKYISLSNGLSDAEFCGITEEGTGGATAIAFGTLCYFKASDSLWYPAKADVTATSGIVKLGMCVLAGTSAATRMLLYGNIRANSLFPSFSPLSGQVYVSAATAGEVTSTAPTGTTNFVVRVVGRASTADELFFNPSEDYVELA